MKIAVVLGFRPEIIKFLPAIRELEQLDLDFFLSQRTRARYDQSKEGRRNLFGDGEAGKRILEY